MDTETKGTAAENIAAGLAGRGGGEVKVDVGSAGAGGAAAAGASEAGKVTATDGKVADAGAGELETLRRKVEALEAQASTEALLKMHAEILAERLPGVPKELLALLPKTADKKAFRAAADSMRVALEKLAPKLPNVGGASRDGGTPPHAQRNTDVGTPYSNLSQGMREGRSGPRTVIERTAGQ